MNVQAIALWVSIAAGGAGIYGVHLQSTQQTADATKAAVQRQHAMDALYTRLGNDEATIAALASQMPEDKREIPSLLVHLPPLVVNEKPSNNGSQEGEESNYETEEPKPYCLFFKWAKFPTFNRLYEKWVLGVGSIAIIVILLRTTGDLLYSTGWSGRIDSWYFSLFERRLSNRERGLISSLCFILAVVVGFHLFCALIIVPHNYLDIQ